MKQYNFWNVIGDISSKMWKIIGFWLSIKNISYFKNNPLIFSINFILSRIKSYRCFIQNYIRYDKIIYDNIFYLFILMSLLLD